MKEVFKRKEGGFVTRIGFVGVLMWVIFMVGATIFSTARATDGEQGVGDQAGKSPVHITSDRVRSDQREKWVEFIGNVRATQEGGVITADSIKIFYKSGGDGTDAVGSQAVEKMVAAGHVKIVFDNQTKTALAEEAVYTAHDQVLVLSGGNPTVQSGQDVIRGEKITLFQAENRTEVEGGEKKQVEATFYSQDAGGLIK